MLSDTYRSESPSQVFFILLTWLMALMQSSISIQPRSINLAYDNICNLCRLNVARQSLPLAPPFDNMWLEVIDMFHLRNHISQCQSKYSAQRLKDQHPHYNTQAGEQTFVWLSRYKHIVCAMTKTHHLFYLHRMVRRRNYYTAKCYSYGRKPVLPKAKNCIP